MIWLWLTVAASADDARSYLDQARFFVKKEWYDDALQQLVIAVGRSEGDADPEAWFLLSQVRYQLCDLQGAREAAQTALDRATDPDHVRQATDYLQYLSTRFGLVQLTSRRGTTPPMTIELTSPVYDPDQKRYVARLAERLGAGPVALPTILGLPSGTYVINGGTVEVGPDATASFDPNRPTGRGIPAILEFGLGGQAWFSNPFAPRPLLDVSLGIPVGPLLLGPMVMYHPAPDDWASLSGGVRLGVELGETWRLRPGLAARYGDGGFVGSVELSLSRHKREKRGALGFGGMLAEDLTVVDGTLVAGTRATLTMAVSL